MPNPFPNPFQPVPARMVDEPVPRSPSLEGNGNEFDHAEIEPVPVPTGSRDVDLVEDAPVLEPLEVRPGETWRQALRREISDRKVAAYEEKHGERWSQILAVLDDQIEKMGRG